MICAGLASPLSHWDLVFAKSNKELSKELALGLVQEEGEGGRGGAHLRTRQGGRKGWLLAFSAGMCESVGVGASVHIVLHCVEVQKCTREYLRLASVCVYLELCVIFAV